jgi:dihydrofolate reductase
MMKNRSLIVAVTQNGVIGRENALPFRLKDDMKHFVQKTLGKNVIMGRKTFESILSAIGKPLPGRENYVLTRDPHFAYPGVKVFNDLESLSRLIDNSDSNQEWVVIGGAEIYRLFLPFVSKIYLTLVDVSLEGDAFFPSLDQEEWETHHTQAFEKNEWNQYGFKIVELWRKKRKDRADSRASKTV